MSVYYLDEDFRVHIDQNQSQTLTTWEDENGFFDGKAPGFIEGYRVVPEGMTWTRPDGVIFHGLMIAPAVEYAVLQGIQAGYDAAMTEAEDMREALKVLGIEEGELA